MHAGATGGGYTLDAGVTTYVSIEMTGPKSNSIIDDNDAKTTQTAVRVLLERAGISGATVRIRQKVQVPVGYGFGASAAASLSAVFAVSSALGLEWRREEIALCAHMAEIQCSTGLGTVSAIYKEGGAGLITKPGAPGIAEFVKLGKPRDIKIVAVCLSPMEKKKIILSKNMRNKINSYGRKCLQRVLEKKTIEELALAGEYFTEKVGLATQELKKLMKRTREAGALSASQNMIGQAMHALVYVDKIRKVKRSLEGLNIQTMEFGIGETGARIFRA